MTQADIKQIEAQFQEVKRAIQELYDLMEQDKDAICTLKEGGNEDAYLDVNHYLLSQALDFTELLDDELGISFH